MLPLLPQSISMQLAPASLFVLLVPFTCATEAILANASPLKPSVDIPCKSLLVFILLVVCGSNARPRSSPSIPQPLSATDINFRPPSSMDTVIFVAPASILFSISSLTTLAGRSITSPAAIIFTIFWSRMTICPIVVSRSPSPS